MHFNRYIHKLIIKRRRFLGARKEAGIKNPRRNTIVDAVTALRRGVFEGLVPVLAWIREVEPL